MISFKHYITRLIDKLSGFIVPFDRCVVRPDEINPAILRHVLDSSLKAGGDDYFFVQIGANDGVINDPIRNFVLETGIRGLFVEPLPDVFERLLSNYGEDARLQFGNYAICWEDADVQIYRMVSECEKAYKKFYGRHGNPTGVSSLSAEHVKKHLHKVAPNFFQKESADDYIYSTVVEGISFDTLISRFKIERIDMMQIDVEGYDGEVVNMVLNSAFRPYVINYENKHLSEENCEEVESRLVEEGYTILEIGDDSCAIRGLKL